MYQHMSPLLFSCSVMSSSLQPHGLQHTRLFYPSPSPGACWNSCPLSWWCHPTISSSVLPFPFCLQSFPASGSFPISHLFAWDGQSIRASASASVLPMNIQGWFPLGLIGLISLLSKELSTIFSSTTIQKHRFFCIQSSLWSNSHIVHDYWKNHSFDCMDLCRQSDVSAFNTLSRLVIAFLPKSKCLLISWQQSPSTVILEPKKRKSFTFPPSICHQVMGPDAMILVFWMLSFKPAFHSPVSPSSRGSLVLLCFLPLEWYYLHIWSCWYFS